MLEIRYVKSISLQRNDAKTILVFFGLVYLVFTSFFVNVSHALNINTNGNIISNNTNRTQRKDVENFRKSDTNHTVAVKSTRTIGDTVKDTADILQTIGLKATIVDDDKPYDKTFFGEDEDGNPVVVGTWFQYGSYTLAVAMFGTAFLISCAATAVYYVIFVVTDPLQTSFTKRSGESSNGDGYLTKIFNTFVLANDIYEKLDFKNPECPEKLVCEVQQSRYFEKSIFKRLSHVILNLNFWNSRVQSIDSLRRADKVGLHSESNCSDSYSTCQFSIDTFHDKLKSLS